MSGYPDGSVDEIELQLAMEAAKNFSVETVKNTLRKMIVLNPLTAKHQRD